MRYISFFILSILFVVMSSVVGCTDRPEIGPQAYGTVVDELPYIKEAEAPFTFPHAGDDDHRNCEFNEEDFL